MSEDANKKKTKRDEVNLEDIAMGKSPELQPKKIGGEWRYPSHMQLPDKHMSCPQCGTQDLIDTKKRTPDHKTIFACKDCKIEFAQTKKAKVAWCKKYEREIVGKECMGCHIFKKNIQQWIEDLGSDARCPNFQLPEEYMPGFHSS